MVTDQVYGKCTLPHIREMALSREAAARNRILGAVGDAIDGLLDDLEPTALAQRQVIYEIDEPISYVYFPQSGVLSVVASANNSEAVEVATVGPEGIGGLPAFLGASRSTMRAFAQIPGDALRMPVDRFGAHCEANVPLRNMLLKYTQAFITQVAQNSACNRLHPVEERCARWILMTHDRVDSERFPLTHDFLAQMLGVRRATVTVAAGALARAGLIEYTRGDVAVLDRAALQEASCECYAIVEAEYTRLLGKPMARARTRNVRQM
jgi:CRP-like cAMP-binding protein